MDYTWGLSLGLEWKLTFSSPVATAEFSKFADRMWSTGEGNGKPLQYSCLENPMNREAVAWRDTVHGVEKSQTRLSN